MFTSSQPWLRQRPQPRPAADGLSGKGLWTRPPLFPCRAARAAGFARGDCRLLRKGAWTRPPLCPGRAARVPGFARRACRVLGKGAWTRAPLFPGRAASVPGFARGACRVLGKGARIRPPLFPGRGWGGSACATPRETATPREELARQRAAREQEAQSHKRANPTTWHCRWSAVMVLLCCRRGADVVLTSVIACSSSAPSKPSSPRTLTVAPGDRPGSLAPYLPRSGSWTPGPEVFWKLTGNFGET